MVEKKQTSLGSKNKKVLVIGLDAATPDLLTRWTKEGKLPILAKLMNEGISGTLRSTMPPLTCPAWLSFMTGKSPGKLGVYGFVERRPGTYEIRYGMDYQPFDERSLWDILGEKGKKVGIFGVPSTFPPRKVNGFMVSGWPIPQGAIFTYPSDLQLKLDTYAGKREGCDRTIHMATWRWFSAEDKFLQGLYSYTEWEVRATRYLLNNYDWDFFMTVFSGIDSIQHFFWKHMDPKHPLYNPEQAEKYGNEILKYYQRIDEIVKELLDSVDDDTRVIIMSDHGGGPFYNFFNINVWLNKKGFLEIEEKTPQSSLLREFLPRKQRIFEPLIKLAHALGLLNIYYFMTDHSSVSRALTGRVRILVGNPKVFDQYLEIPAVWSKTKAYSFGSGEMGRIYINLKGREPQGIVKPGKEYEELRDQLIEELRNLKDPVTGKKVDIDIFKKEEIYHGEHLDKGPDIVFFINKERTRINWTFDHDSFFTYDLSLRRDNAGHRTNGILIMKGPEIKKGEKISQAEIIDVAPTILYMIGYPIPSDMDGKVLKDAFDPPYLKSNPIRYEKMTKKARGPKYKWSKEEEERIKKKLEALGYI